MGYEHHGIYVSNRAQLTEEEYQLVRDGRFRKAIVRLDTSVDVAARLEDMGLEIFIQATDMFNRSTSDPALYARTIWDRLQVFQPFARWITLDNEPNLFPEKAGQWWAEQYTRWFRAVMAAFRYYDGYTCHWKLIHPAFCQQPGRYSKQWIKTCRENILESEAMSAHCYWTEGVGIKSPLGGYSYEAYRKLYPNHPLYITEYNPNVIWFSDEQRAAQAVEYLDSVQRVAEGAFWFILGGTQTWKRFWLSSRVSHLLGQATK